MAQPQTLTLTIQPNDETQDNGCVTPGGGAVSLQLNRGFTTTIPNYRIAVCTRGADGSLAIERDVGSGAHPSPQNPNGPPPLFVLGTPTQMSGRVVVVLADGVALPPNAVGQIDIVVDLFQPTAAAAPRRVKWTSIGAQAIQLPGARFEITFSPVSAS